MIRHFRIALALAVLAAALPIAARRRVVFMLAPAARVLACHW